MPNSWIVHEGMHVTPERSPKAQIEISKPRRVPGLVHALLLDSKAEGLLPSTGPNKEAVAALHKKPPFRRTISTRLARAARSGPVAAEGFAQRCRICRQDKAS